MERLTARSGAASSRWIQRKLAIDHEAPYPDRVGEADDMGRAFVEDGCGDFRPQVEGATDQSIGRPDRGRGEGRANDGDKADRIGQSPRWFLEPYQAAHKRFRLGRQGYGLHREPPGS